MAADVYLAFDGNESTNKKIRKLQSFKGYWSEGNQWNKRAIIANTDWVITFIGLQYLVHAGDKCIRSIFCYLSQFNGY